MKLSRFNRKPRVIHEITDSPGPANYSMSQIFGKEGLKYSLAERTSSIPRNDKINHGPGHYDIKSRRNPGYKLFK